MPAKGPTARICDWACSTRYQDIPQEVRREAIKILIDEVGCMVAGASLESVRPVVSLVRALGGDPQCTIVGHPLRVPVLQAALANGAIGHSDEVDATSARGAGHFAATMVPAALTAGQYTKSSGTDFLRAFILGAEVAARMQSAIKRNEHERPQFYYSPGAALGVAVTAGLMLRLDADRMEHALGAAAMGCAPLMSFHQEPLHQTKSLAYSGRTARAGIESALLAMQGLHAPREILTAENGFFHAFTGRRNAGHETVVDLGARYLMRDICYKRYSAAGDNLAPLYALFQLFRRYALTGDDVAEIEVTGAGTGSAGTTDHHPSVHTETVLSLAACYGEFTFSHAHDPAYLSDPRYLAFRSKARVNVLSPPPATGRTRRFEAALCVRTRSGNVYRQDVSYPPMTEEEIDTKFCDLVGLRLDHARTTDLARKLKNIENCVDVSGVVDDLGIGISHLP